MNDPIRPHADEGLKNCVWDYTTHRSDTLPQRVFFFLPSLARAPHCHRYCPRPQRWCVSDSVSPSRSRMRDEQRRTIYYFLTNILAVRCEKTRFVLPLVNARRGSSNICKKLFTRWIRLLCCRQAKARAGQRDCQGVWHWHMSIDISLTYLNRVHWKKNWETEEKKKRLISQLIS